ncbi:hypothetical protein ACJJTC_008851 [Scirpophaga incertulas]
MKRDMSVEKPAIEFTAGNGDKPFNDQSKKTRTKSFVELNKCCSPPKYDKKKSKSNRRNLSGAARKRYNICLMRGFSDEEALKLCHQPLSNIPCVAQKLKVHTKHDLNENKNLEQVIKKEQMLESIGETQGQAFVEKIHGKASTEHKLQQNAEHMQFVETIDRRQSEDSLTEIHEQFSVEQGYEAKKEYQNLEQENAIAMFKQKQIDPIEGTLLLAFVEQKHSIAAVEHQANESMDHNTKIKETQGQYVAEEIYDVSVVEQQKNQYIDQPTLAIITDIQTQQNKLETQMQAPEGIIEHQENQHNEQEQALETIKQNKMGAIIDEIQQIVSVEQIDGYTILTHHNESANLEQVVAAIKQRQIEITDEEISSNNAQKQDQIPTKMDAHRLEVTPTQMSVNDMLSQVSMECNEYQNTEQEKAVTVIKQQKSNVTVVLNTQEQLSVKNAPDQFTVQNQNSKQEQVVQIKAKLMEPIKEKIKKSVHKEQAQTTIKHPENFDAEQEQGLVTITLKQIDAIINEIQQKACVEQKYGLITVDHQNKNAYLKQVLATIKRRQTEVSVNETLRQAYIEQKQVKDFVEKTQSQDLLVKTQCQQPFVEQGQVKGKENVEQKETIENLKWQKMETIADTTPGNAFVEHAYGQASIENHQNNNVEQQQAVTLLKEKQEEATASKVTGYCEGTHFDGLMRIPMKIQDMAVNPQWNQNTASEDIEFRIKYNQTGTTFIETPGPASEPLVERQQQMPLEDNYKVLIEETPWQTSLEHMQKQTTINHPDNQKPQEKQIETDTLNQMKFEDIAKESRGKYSVRNPEGQASVENEEFKNIELMQAVATLGKKQVVFNQPFKEITTQTFVERADRLALKRHQEIQKTKSGEQAEARLNEQSGAIVDDALKQATIEQIERQENVAEIQQHAYLEEIQWQELAASFDHTHFQISLEDKHWSDFAVSLDDTQWQISEEMQWPASVGDTHLQSSIERSYWPVTLEEIPWEAIAEVTQMQSSVEQSQSLASIEGTQWQSSVEETQWLASTERKQSHVSVKESHRLGPVQETQSVEKTQWLSVKQTHWPDCVGGIQWQVSMEGTNLQTSLDETQWRASTKNTQYQYTTVKDTLWSAPLELEQLQLSTETPSPTTAEKTAFINERQWSAFEIELYPVCTDKIQRKTSPGETYWPTVDRTQGQASVEGTQSPSFEVKTQHSTCKEDMQRQSSDEKIQWPTSVVEIQGQASEFIVDHQENQNTKQANVALTIKEEHTDATTERAQGAAFVEPHEPHADPYFEINLNSIKVAIFNDQQPLTPLDVELIKANLLERIDLSVSGLRFNGMTFEAGYLMITCLNDESVKWIFEKTKAIKTLQGARLKTVLVEDLSKPIVVIACLKNEVDPKTILIRLDKQNPGIGCASWKILHCKEELEGQTFYFSVNDESLSILKQVKYKLCLNFDVIQLKIKLDNVMKKENDARSTSAGDTKRRVKTHKSSRMSRSVATTPVRKRKQHFDLNSWKWKL